MPSLVELGLPSFDEIEASLQSDSPHHWGLKSARNLSLISEPDRGSLQLLCPNPEMELIDNLGSTIIEVASRSIKGTPYHSVGSSFGPLLREVYYFICGVVTRSESTNDAFPIVVAHEFSAWESILKVPESMDRNRRIGLQGELWILWRALSNLGPDALASWNGPLSEQHDFRLAELDLEVKSTLSHSREHVVGTLGQLENSGGRALAVVSVQLKPAGSGPGASLKDSVDAISATLAAHPAVRKSFESKIASLGYREADPSVSKERFCLRTCPTIVPVDDDFPRLTNVSLASIMSSSAVLRVRKVAYTLNLDGLGLDIGSPSTPAALTTPDVGDLYA